MTVRLGRGEERRAKACPVCGAPGRVVRAETLRALLKPEPGERVTESRYRFCGAQACDVVYFSEDGPQRFNREDLTVRVGVKETKGPRPICYCFGHTAEEMIEQIKGTGRTSVPDDIRSRLETEGCHCERTNPQGSCCLGVVLAFAEEAARRFGHGGCS
jgi:hypothetical protein